MTATTAGHYADRLNRELLDTQNELGRNDSARVETIAAPGDLSNVPQHNADADSEGLRVRIAEEQREREKLEAIEAALLRIESGQFGLCTACQTPIDEERLDAAPWAAKCASCAREDSWTRLR
ncbi:TraR/DksA C4-type zinc finger protein [Botrimarina sp.]|uniref:TraR/DksA family transcriptional regulator n=1 Tax=Botrimarina sp. TaxID=2795802 RepID=UPI0032EBDBC1